MVASND
jgi:hypothetical protein